MILFFVSFYVLTLPFVLENHVKVDYVALNKELSEQIKLSKNA